MAEIPALFTQHPIVLRHHKAAMYYPFIEGFAHTMVDIPFTFVIQAVFAVILYLLVDLQRTTSQFFIFFPFVFPMTITRKAFFRMVAACFKTESAATSLAGIVVVVVALFTGYTIPKPNIPGALRWIMYINPVRYGFEALLMNEFHTLSGACSTLVPSGPTYPNISLTNHPIICWTIEHAGCQPYRPREAYTVPISGGMQCRLLDGISGFVAPGKLTALMGELGAGKTTLLNILAQHVDVGVVTGDRLVSGQPSLWTSRHKLATAGRWIPTFLNLPLERLSYPCNGRYHEGPYHEP